MTGINHAATGALVAAAINKPVLALPAALLSHFAVDMIPHWDYKVPGGTHSLQKVMALDLVLSLSVIFLLAITVSATPWVIVAGGFLGILPDTMWLQFFLTGEAGEDKNDLMKWLRKSHLWIQWSETSQGFFVELLWLPLMLWLIYQVHH